MTTRGLADVPIFTSLKSAHADVRGAHGTPSAQTPATHTSGIVIWWVLSRPTTLRARRWSPLSRPCAAEAAAGSSPRHRPARPMRCDEAATPHPCGGRAGLPEAHC